MKKEAQEDARTKTRAQVNTSCKLEIMKQYTIQVEMSNYYNKLFLWNNVKLYLVSLILVYRGHFHFDHFYMMLKAAFDNPKLHSQTSISAIFRAKHSVVAHTKLIFDLFRCFV